MSANSDRVLDEARILMQDRGRIYGSPYTNHKRISEIWSALLDYPITPHQVVLLMVGLKMARLMETPSHHDSVADAVAYFSFYEDVLEGELDADYSKF